MINLKKYDNTPISNLLQLSDFESETGWIKFPDGALIHYGTTDIPAGTGTASNPLTINLREAYVGMYAVTTACVFANTSESIYSIGIMSEKSFKIYSNTPNVANIVSWIAIGRWK